MYVHICMALVHIKVVYKFSNKLYKLLTLTGFLCTISAAPLMSTNLRVGLVGDSIQTIYRK